MLYNSLPEYKVIVDKEEKNIINIYALHIHIDVGK